MQNWRRGKEREKAMKEEKPRGLSSSVMGGKRRRLSLGDAKGMGSKVKGVLLGKKRKRISDQMDSVLFGRFPLEVREMIYGYVLVGASHLHVYRRADRRMGHYVCGHHDDDRGHGKSLERKRVYCAWEQFPATLPTGLMWAYDETVTGAWDVRRSTRRQEDKHDLLSLLLSCKRVYVYTSSLQER